MKRILLMVFKNILLVPVSEYLTGSVHVDQIVSQSGTPGKLYTGRTC